MRMLVSLAFVASVLSLPVAMAQSPYKGDAFIRNHANGKCLDFARGDRSDSVTLQQWPCASNVSDLRQTNHQQWWLINITGRYPNNAPAYVFQNAANFTCIAVENDSLANAARIVQRQCDVNNPSQHWIMLTRADPIERGMKTKWMNGRSGKCLDIWNNDNGTVFQQYDCAKASYWPQQMFSFIWVPYP